VAQYRSHYERVYCPGNIKTFDGIRVFFGASKFGHMFYESSARDGRKDVFSPARAQRIDWIKSTLERPKADLFEGWDKASRAYDATRGCRLRGFRSRRGDGTKARWLVKGELCDLLSSRQQHRQD
jgi:hypothetical protein